MPSGKIQIEWRTTGSGDCNTASGLACKHQLRGTGCWAGCEVISLWGNWALESNAKNLLVASFGCCLQIQSCVTARWYNCAVGQIFCAFGRSHLPNARQIREHTRFAHPYRFLL